MSLNWSLILCKLHFKYNIKWEKWEKCKKDDWTLKLTSLVDTNPYNKHDR